MTGQRKVRYVTKAAETGAEYVRMFNVKVGTTDEQDFKLPDDDELHPEWATESQ